MSTTASTDHAPAVEARDQPVYEAWQLFYDLFAIQKPRMLDVQAAHGLTPPQFFALQALDEPAPMGKIATVLRCDSSNLTWITDRLEERGLVERQSDPRDRRVKLLVLTDAGRRVRDAITAQLAIPPKPLMRLSRADQRALRDILKRALSD